MKIGKYEFNSKAEAVENIEALGTATDENGNEYPTHQNAIVHLGNIVLEPAEIDSNGNVTKEAVVSNKYSVDVLWTENEHSAWQPYRIEVAGNGSHSFSGLDYNDYKI